MPHRVLIVGASVRAAAQSARRAGWGVVAADMFGDLDLRECAEVLPVRPFPDALPHAARQLRLPVLCTGAMENHPHLLADLPRLWGIRGEPLAIARNPFRWTRLLAEHGVPTLPVRAADNPPEAPQQWLAKPLASAGGLRITLAGKAKLPADWFFQRIAAGVPLSATFVGTASGARLCGACRQIAGLADVNARPFAWCGAVGPLQLPHDLQQQLRLIGETLTQSAGLRGLFGVDLILNEDQLLLPLEINPRYTASVEVLELATQTQLLPAHRLACLDRPLPEPDSTAAARRVAKLVLYARDPMVAPDLTSLRQRDSSWLADVPIPGSSLPAGGPLCTVLATGTGFPSALAAAAQHAGALQHIAGLDPHRLAQALSHMAADLRRF